MEPDLSAQYSVRGYKHLGVPFEDILGRYAGRGRGTVEEGRKRRE